MPSYISSNQNRFYVGLEGTYGQAAQTASISRYPAVHLQAHQAVEVVHRRAKTGSRTFLGSQATARRVSIFETQTYLTSWAGSGQPAYGPLVQAALGGTPQISSGLAVAAVQNANSFQTISPHGLSIGSAVSCNGEIRFVTAVPAPTSI